MTTGFLNNGDPVIILEANREPLQYQAKENDIIPSVKIRFSEDNNYLLIENATRVIKLLNKKGKNVRVKTAAGNGRITVLSLIGLHSGQYYLMIYNNPPYLIQR